MADRVLKVVDRQVRVSVASGTLVAALAAQAALPFAVRAEAALAEIEDIASGAPDAPSILNKADKDLSNLSEDEAVAATEVLGWQASVPALRRLLRSRIGEVVSAKDYVVGNGSADDGEAYQALINAQPAEIFYPEGCEIAVTASMLWIGDQTHRFANDTRVLADLDDSTTVLGYGVMAQGYPDLLPITVAAIARNALSFVVSSASGLAVGDDIYIYDTVADEYDVNTIRAVVGTTVYMKRPVNFAFSTAANIRVYKLANACRNLKVFGGEIRNVRDSISAHGIAFRFCTDLYVEGLSAYETGGIGMSPAISQRMVFNQVSAIRTGASGMGARWIKDFRISGFVSRDPGTDEGLTFYKNCTHGLVDAPDIAQYLTGEAPAGSPGNGGNDILLDERCCDITIRDSRLRGSRTYGIFINNGSDRNVITNPQIQLADLGGIRLAQNCHDNRILGGWVTDVIQSADSEQSGIATAAIQDDATCSGNVLGDGTQFARIAGGVNVRQLGTAGASSMRVRGAMSKKASAQTAFNATAAPSIAFDSSIYDTNAIHDTLTNNTRFTVPAGVTFVEIGCLASLSLVANPAIFSLTAKKNGSTSFDGACGAGETTTGNPDPDIMVVSGPIPVVSGDYFEWQLYCDDASITINAKSNAWMRLLD